MSHDVRAPPSAVHVVSRATFDFNLDGRVSDVEAVLDVVDDRAQHLLTLANTLFGDEDMAAARDDAGPDHPDVEIVHVEHPADAFDGRDDGWHVHAGGSAFEEHGATLSQHAVAAVQDETGNQQRDNRIRE